ncbi:MAG TPA: phosphoribosylglycinamide formyltransferase [Candidatus Scatosoma pullistercoris]|uniref:Phosphoribosylglycinamide formyltransferase n=1 Tax=Candidatus Scatosoma pullistercoris TaxID=2840934 RepID=A0A9D1MEJ8_9FIRM|nr:phosphoribosylglycinamide formyltransferase [Candidatus Scatosoma pullistercoris]
MKNIAVFASGGGTDFQSVIDANEREKFCVIKYLIASKEGIGAIERAKKAGIPAAVFAKKDYSSLEELYDSLSALLEGAEVDYIVLAGWLKIIPPSFIARFRDRIINIHPSLIPAFCGAGYYGLKVHEAALSYGVKVSGATVHFVEAEVDGGAIVMQRAVPVLDGDTPELLQKRVLETEHEMLPLCVQLLCEGKIEKEGRQVRIRA